MKVTYSEDRKHAYFNGEKFTKDEKTGYCHKKRSVS